MSDLSIRIEGRAGRITLTRPKALNALSYEMCLAIEDALDAFDGNIAKAAAALEISPSTIYRKRQSWSDRIEGGDSALFTGFAG